MRTAFSELVIDRDPYPIPVDRYWQEEPIPVDPDYYCRQNFKVKDKASPYLGKWTQCYRRAGWGTAHLGFGNCKHHGGNTGEQIARYNAINNPTLHELIEHYLEDVDPLNLHQELAVARAILQNELDSREKTQEALIAWHASFHKDRRGLHDHPLYHAFAIKEALDAGDIQKGWAVEKIQAGLERGMHVYLERWKQMGKEANLKLDKPMRTESMLAALRAITEIRALVKDIAKLEEDAYLSAFAVEQTLKSYGAIVKDAIIKVLKEKGVLVEEAENVLTVIAQRWNKVPLAESSVPRLAAATRGSAE